MSILLSDIEYEHDYVHPTVCSTFNVDGTLPVPVQVQKMLY